jgi:hypothetical protein
MSAGREGPSIAVIYVSRYIRGYLSMAIIYVSRYIKDRYPVRSSFMSAVT